MKWKILLLLYPTLVFSVHQQPTEQKLTALYNRLDPTSITQHLTLYELYSDHLIGKRALQDTWKLLLNGQPSPYTQIELPISDFAIDAIISLINKQPNQDFPLLKDSELSLIESIAAPLKNRLLPGYSVWIKEDLVALPPEHIDLARGLLLNEFDETQTDSIRSYEALLDLMALQILTRLPVNASDEDKIREISRLIFDEIGFRFPPQSTFAKDIDVYTMLPAVLSSKRGVCLGVSILYLCLAQRLGLNLEIITPPGHIYVRYCSPTKIINIETTARGIHLDSDEYLTVNVCGLERRNIKEVIGLAHVNQAAVYWRQKQYNDALNSYKKAYPYLLEDLHLRELMGYITLLSGDEVEGRKLLSEVKNFTPPHLVTKLSIAEDFINGKVGIEGLEVIFAAGEEDRESILKQKDQLESLVNQFPEFRAGLVQLAMTWVELHRMKEALEVLKRYDRLDSTDPDVNYYLSVLYAQRLDYNLAWKHLKRAEEIVKCKNFNCKALKEVRKALTLCRPEPEDFEIY